MEVDGLGRSEVKGGIMGLRWFESRAGFFRVTSPLRRCTKGGLEGGWVKEESQGRAQ